MPYWTRQKHVYWALKQQERRRARIASDAAETPLQQAVIAAWEGGSTVFPAVKGSPDIPVFDGKTPGSTVIGGVPYRSSQVATGQSVSLTPSPVNLFGGTRTFRAFFRLTKGTNEGFIAVSNSGIRANSSGDQWVGYLGGTSSLNIRTRIGVSSDSNRISVSGASWDAGDLWRLEIEHTAGSATIRLRNITKSLDYSDTNSIYYDGAETPGRLGILSSSSSNSATDFGPCIYMDRAMTTEERADDLSPRVFADL